MIPFAYTPPPQPVQQVVVQQPAPAASAPAPRERGFKPPESWNRQQRRAYEAAVMRRLRHKLFTKTMKRAAPHLVSVLNCRAELKGFV
jgi:hypothetical protein